MGFNAANAMPKCVGEQSFEWKDCQGTFTFENGEEYVGEFNNGIPHGQGNYILEDGSIYSGGFKDGAKHGQGTFSYSNGEKYVGEFKDNKYHGKGTQTTTEGEKYIGEFIDGLRDGYSVIIFSDGMKYEGGFRNDMMHGKAIITYPNGKKVTEFFSKGKIVDTKLDVEEIEEKLKESDLRKLTSSGYQYFDGLNGFKKDIKKSAELWKLAADQGYAEAQYQLGISYIYGEGVKKDLAIAYMWIQISLMEHYRINHKSGLEDSYRKKEYILSNDKNLLNNNGMVNEAKNQLDDLYATMPSRDLIKGISLANSCWKRKFKNCNR